METPVRIMGIDFGTTRLGLALSDPLRILAQPYLTIPNNKQTMEAIRDIVMREGVRLIVVGMPLNLKGEKGKKALEVEDFIVALAGVVNVDILPWDERFTTYLAHQTLRQMGTRRKEREGNRGRVDSMAASLLLQSYLDSLKRSMNC